MARRRVYPRSRAKRAPEGVLGWFVLGLGTGWSLQKTGRVDEGSTEVKDAAEA